MLTFPENLRELASWRDQHAPDMPIWMTETGYDSDGPFGTTEAMQAARLPRVVMLCLANGVDKVFVYRESGSTASMHAASGVLRDDLTPKPSWYTFGTLVRELREARGTATRLPHPDPNVWLMEGDCAGEPLLTVWTVDGTATLGLELGPCTVTDAFGGQAQPKSTLGLPLSPYPRYIRGANPAALEPLRLEHGRLEAERAGLRERVIALRKYLYDFGTLDNLGDYLAEGIKTAFTPVLAAAVWDDARGYGFDAPALGDDDRAWLRDDALGRDSTKVRDHVFRFRIEPGTYDLVVRVEPFGEKAELAVAVGDAEPRMLAVRKDAATVSAELSVADPGAEVTVQVVGDYANLYWLACVERLGS